MRNLIQFLTRYSSFFIFLALEAICFLIVYRTHDFQQSSILHSANTLSGNVLNIQHNVREYLYLKLENDSLRVENALLRSSHVNAFESQRFLTDTVCTDDLSQIYTYTPTKVLYNTTTKTNNYLTLNKGYKHGIKPEMGVIGANGIVGIVTKVSENFCAVMSVLHSETIISCQLKKEAYEGKLTWIGPSPLIAELSGIPQHVALSKGDTVMTSGFSSIFPDNYMVGTISNYTLPAGSNFYSVSLKLSTNFQSLRYAYIVKYLYKDERKKLELMNE